MSGEDDDGEHEHEHKPYEIGYGRPPPEHRFVKDAPSPNPSGRPRGSQDRKALTRQIADEPRAYSEGQRRRQTTTLKLVLLTVRNRVAQGDLLAISIWDWLSGRQVIEETQIPKGVLILGEKLNADEWEAEFGHLADRYD